MYRVQLIYAKGEWFKVYAYDYEEWVTSDRICEVVRTIYLAGAAVKVFCHE